MIASETLQRWHKTIELAIGASSPDDACNECVAGVHAPDLGELHGLEQEVFRAYVDAIEREERARLMSAPESIAAP